MTDSDLLALDKIGFIPGPLESEENFLARVAQTKEQYEQGEWIPESHWSWVREYLDQLFHVKPLYICAFYSNKKLAPWQGAAAWIEGRNLKAIQLREGFKKGSYLGIYSREEILAHEAVHAARSGFDESGCEEFFAYMTSEKRWRRVLGPIIRAPWEVWPFLFFALIGPFFSVGYLGAAFWVGLGFTRLIKQRWILKKASENLFKITRDQRAARAILFRLTDDEIQVFGKGCDILSYGNQQTCLRWRVIQNYLKGEIWQKKSS